ncbi:hypothetical protein P879_00565 [Paragonimus westermani]|uniref:Uncharacterized protein n=1 Tax=Paragonimus westermani TaxID=34504 RepID=A0A8T0DTT9_9TREM|nr:hypothetical protein P879_00565 [Paragonimus westermani]
METDISSAEFRVILCYDGIERGFRSICTQKAEDQHTHSPTLNLVEGAIISQEKTTPNDKLNGVLKSVTSEKETTNVQHSSFADVNFTIDDDSLSNSSRFYLYPVAQRKVKFAPDAIVMVEPDVYADDEYGLDFSDDEDMIPKQPPTRYSYAKGEWMGKPVSQWIDDSYLRLPPETEPPLCHPRKKAGIYHPTYVDDSIDLLNLPELLQVIGDFGCYSNAFVQAKQLDKVACMLTTRLAKADGQRACQFCGRPIYSSQRSKPLATGEDYYCCEDYHRLVRFAMEYAKILAQTTPVGQTSKRKYRPKKMKIKRIVSPVGLISKSGKRQDQGRVSN